MEGDLINTNKALLPLSWLYGLGVNFRNMLFEMGILKSRSFDVPVISVGNITVGGTGKTPHVEYLIRLLKDNFKVAVLSRGYKRKTHGFLRADKNSTVRDIGDEPFQMKTKFPDITVAVDGKRTRGINQLTSGDSDSQPDVILLDDAFQHRYVPSGRLREPVKSKDRADIVIITKCPTDMKPMEYRVITKAMSLYPYQQLFFSTHVYEPPRPVFQKNAKTLGNFKDMNVLLLSGIASPEQMLIDLQERASQITPLSFSDHHNFSKKDIMQINEVFAGLPSPKVIITTEKDETRLLNTEGLSDEVKRSLYVLPVKVSFMLDQEETFNKHIISYVRKNSRNSILAKGKDDNKPKDSDHSGDRPRTISFRNN